MNAESLTTEDRFIGCLLGLAVGDALGAHFEGQTCDHIARQYRTAASLIENPPPGELWYTDDTQMAIGVAETLIACGRIDEQTLCDRFAANYLPQRGYGRVEKVVLQAMCDGEDHRSGPRTCFRAGHSGTARQCALRRSAFCSVTIMTAFGIKHDCQHFPPTSTRWE